MLPKIYHNVIATVQRQEGRKDIRKGNEIREKERSNQNTLAVLGGGSSCILLKPGNPCSGMATGTLPASSTTGSNALPSHPHITLVMQCFPKPHRGDGKTVCYETIQVLGHFFKWDLSPVVHFIKIIHWQQKKKPNKNRKPLPLPPKKIRLWNIKSQKTAYFSKGKKWLLAIKPELGQAFNFLFFLSVVYEIQVATKQHVLSDQYFPPPGMDLAFRNFSTFEDFWTTHDTSPWLQYIN